VKRLLFGAVIVMMSVISSAVANATPGDNWADRPWLDGECKWCGSHAYSLPVCHLVKERVGTRHGHPVYQTRQVCG
jgi:hypothetical protein